MEGRHSSNFDQNLVQLISLLLLPIFVLPVPFRNLLKSVAIPRVAAAAKCEHIAIRQKYVWQFKYVSIIIVNVWHEKGRKKIEIVNFGNLVSLQISLFQHSYSLSKCIFFHLENAKSLNHFYKVFSMETFLQDLFFCSGQYLSDQWY